jgi:hypothetical protein
VSLTRYRDVGFEVLRVVTMKITVFGDMTPCSPVDFSCVSEECATSSFWIEGSDCHGKKWFL